MKTKFYEVPGYVLVAILAAKTGNPSILNQLLNNHAVKDVGKTLSNAQKSERKRKGYGNHKRKPKP